MIKTSGHPKLPFHPFLSQSFNIFWIKFSIFHIFLKITSSCDLSTSTQTLDIRSLWQCPSWEMFSLRPPYMAKPPQSSFLYDVFQVRHPCLYNTSTCSDDPNILQRQGFLEGTQHLCMFLFFLCCYLLTILKCVLTSMKS